MFFLRCLFIILLAQLSYAQELPLLDNKHDSLLDKLQNKPEPHFLPAIVKDKVRVVDIDEGPCFKVKQVKLHGNTVLADDRIATLFEDYLNRCLTANAIVAAKNRLLAYYLDKGFVTTQVSFMPHIMSDGLLEFKVIEGVVEDIVIHGDIKTMLPISPVATALPNVVGSILNVRDIEQGLDQLQRQSSYQAKIDIVPGSYLGASILHIYIEVDRSLRTSIIYDNHGDPNTGKRNATVALKKDNLMGLNDSWMIAMRKDAEPRHFEHNSAQRFFNVSMPYGSYLAALTYVRSDQLRSISGVTEEFLLASTLETTNFGLERMFFRDRLSKFDVGLQFQTDEIKTFIEDIKIDSASLSLTSGIIYANYFHNTGWGKIDSRVTYKRGMKLLHATRDKGGLAFYQPRAQYQYVEVKSDATIPIEWRDFSVKYLPSFVSQYTNVPLYNINKFRVGGLGSVRGFHDTIFVGDIGFTLLNEFSTSLKLAGDFALLQPYLSELEPYASYDIGMVRARGGKSAQAGTGYGYASSAVLGVRSKNNRYNFDVHYAQSINAPSFVIPPNRSIVFFISVPLL